METLEKKDIKSTPEWRLFVKKEKLSADQASQFERYLIMLMDWNKKFNLTSIDTVTAIIAHHFRDSLAVGAVQEFKEGDMLCDVGSGGGFPGIPLKIRYPHVRVVLLEVNQKKISFLNAVIEELGLVDCEVSSLDWRTYLRVSTDPVTYFLARASLRPEELVRMFQAGCQYKHATLIYWAAASWEMEPKETPFFAAEHAYTLDSKHRRLIVFALPK